MINGIVKFGRIPKGEAQSEHSAAELRFGEHHEKSAENTDVSNTYVQDMGIHR